jgi:hypothetical protein
MVWRSRERRLSGSVRPTNAARQWPRPLRFESLEPRAMLSINGDFNGDGFDDLAVGAYFEVVGTVLDAGAVTIVYGGRKGLKTTGDQTWTMNSPGVDGVAAAEDYFGSSLAVGDFNGDRYSDLAIGAYGKAVGGKSRAGTVTVLFGSAQGLTSTNDQLWSQDSSGINDVAETDDIFGYALAAGDFNGDGRDDLAIGSFGEAVGANTYAGAVNVIYGASSGLTNSNDQFWTQNSSGINDVAETDDLFGCSLVAGDFNGDERDDLAIGANGEAIGTLGFAGAVNVIYGGSSGLSGSNDQFWAQGLGGTPDVAEAFDLFGYALAAGDFNGDGRDDLAVGVPEEDTTNTNDGAVDIFYGSASRLTAFGSVHWTGDSLGYADRVGAKLGGALIAADFDGDGNDDLAIGAPEEDSTTAAFAGSVYVVYGSAVVGLLAETTQRWDEDTGNIGNFSEDSDYLGKALTAGDYNGDGYADLAIGVLQDNFAGTRGGAVLVLHGFHVGLFEIDHRLLFQNHLSSTDGTEEGDYFGSALG